MLGGLRHHVGQHVSRMPLRRQVEFGEREEEVILRRVAPGRPVPHREGIDHPTVEHRIVRDCHTRIRARWGDERQGALNDTETVLGRPVDVALRVH